MNKDYDVLYDSPKYGEMIIGNIVASSENEALKIAQTIYSNPEKISVAIV